MTPKEHYVKALAGNRISNILQDSNILNQLHGYGRYGILKHHAIGNVMMVGDAGRFLDPFLCYGVRQSILSGYNAANICKSSLESYLDVSMFIGDTFDFKTIIMDKSWNSSKSIFNVQKTNLRVTEKSWYNYISKR